MLVPPFRVSGNLRYENYLIHYAMNLEYEHSSCSLATGTGRV